MDFNMHHPSSFNPPERGVVTHFLESVKTYYFWDNPVLRLTFLKVRSTKKSLNLSRAETSQKAMNDFLTNITVNDIFHFK